MRMVSLVLSPASSNVAVTVKFTVVQPSGAPLVHYRTGPGPHTGVHLILVRDDLSTIIHRHPPIAADGTATFAGNVTRVISAVDQYGNRASYPSGGCGIRPRFVARSRS